MAVEVDRERLAWWAFGAALGIVVLYVLYRFVGTFVIGLFLYYATRPIYRRVRPRVDQASVAAAGSLALLVLPALLLLSYTAAIAYRQLTRVLDRADQFARNADLQQYDQLVQDYLEASQLLTNPEELLTGGGARVAGDLLMTSAGYLGDVGLFLLHLFVIVAIAFYLLRDDRRVADWVRTRFTDDRGALSTYLERVDDDFNNIFFGNILNAVATGTIGAISYTVLNLVAPAGVSIPYAALVGLIAGVASLIPIVGMKLVYVPVGVYLFAVPLVTNRPEVMWFPVVFAAVSFVIVDTIPDLLLRPYVSGRSLHVGALMLAYVLGPLLFGWYGLFLAPMLLVLVVHFARIVLPELLEGERIRPYAIEPTALAGEPAPPPASAGSPPGPGPEAAADVTGDEPAETPEDSARHHEPTDGTDDPPPESTRTDQVDAADGEGSSSEADADGDGSSSEPASDDVGQSRTRPREADRSQADGS